MTGAHVAAHAAAEAKKRRQLEEESMAGYTNNELSGEWEFKIVRSATNAFRRPNVLAQVVEREQTGGWELVEKFDDGRLRFKRPYSARANDAMLPKGYNPYATQYGIGEGGLALWVILAIGISLALVLGIVFLAKGSL